jgi:hypothetical protein
MKSTEGVCATIPVHSISCDFVCMVGSLSRDALLMQEKIQEEEIDANLPGVPHKGAGVF